MAKFKDKRCHHCSQFFTPYAKKNHYCSARCRILTSIKEVPSGCWEWQGARLIRRHGGYGLLRWKNQAWRAHRLAYEVWKGPIPNGLGVLHQCDNACCCRPEHLTVGTQKQNSIEAVERGRIKTGGDSPYAKVTNRQAEEIRRRANAGENQTKIALDYGISQQQVSAIKRNTRHAKPAEKL